MARRAYTRLASLLDARLFATGLQARAFRKLRREQARGSAGAIPVIVMPRTLHFLLPCLACIPASVPLVLLANGAAGWELDYLRRAVPGRPLFRISTLPGSSVAHGDVVSFLLAHEDAGELRARLPPTAETRRMLAVVDGLIERLRATAPREEGHGDGQ